MQPMPNNVDWPMLVALLDATYKRGDGGLAAESGINASTLTAIRDRGVYSHTLAVTLWNLAIKRVDPDDQAACVMDSISNG